MLPNPSVEATNCGKPQFALQPKRYSRYLSFVSSSQVQISRKIEKARAQPMNNPKPRRPTRPNRSVEPTNCSKRQSAPRIERLAIQQTAENPGESQCQVPHAQVCSYTPMTRNV